MSQEGRVSIDLDLVFVKAGVGFKLQVGESNGVAGASLQIVLRALEEGKKAHFTADSSHALADFVGGFCRWLGTKGVTVSHRAQEISGHFHPQHTVAQMLLIAQELCQMLEDKFGAYPYAIVN